MPTQTTDLFLIEDLEKPDTTGALAARDREALRAVRRAGGAAVGVEGHPGLLQGGDVALDGARGDPEVGREPRG